MLLLSNVWDIICGYRLFCTVFIASMIQNPLLASGIESDVIEKTQGGSVLMSTELFHLVDGKIFVGVFALVDLLQVVIFLISGLAIIAQFAFNNVSKLKKPKKTKAKNKKRVRR